MEAISRLFEQKFCDYSSKKSPFPGYRKLDNDSFEFTDWDWGGL